MNIIDKLFLVKEIVSRDGKVHFRRWALIESPLFNVYIHKIARSDEEADAHNHPWKFWSLILKGGYTERLWDNWAAGMTEVRRGLGSIAFRSTLAFHKITLHEGKPAWTLVVTGARRPDLWGYNTDRGFVDNIQYRQEKHADQ